VGGGDEGDVLVPTGERAALEVVESDGRLQLAVVLDVSPQFRDADRITAGDVGWRVGRAVLDRLVLAFGAGR
jgi:hypothetical protein